MAKNDSGAGGCSLIIVNVILIGAIFINPIVAVAGFGVEFLLGIAWLTDVGLKTKNDKKNKNTLYYVPPHSDNTLKKNEDKDATVDEESTTKNEYKYVEASNMTGVEYEHYVAEYLREHGYKDVTVTQASGDFGADIIAYGDMGIKFCIQCKYYSHPVGVKAVQEVNSAKSHYNADAAVIFTNSSYTKQAIELSASNNVRLYQLVPKVKRQKNVQNNAPSQTGTFFTYEEKVTNDIEWIDRIEDYHAFMDD